MIVTVPNSISLVTICQESWTTYTFRQVIRRPGKQAERSLPFPHRPTPTPQKNVPPCKMAKKHEMYAYIFNHKHSCGSLG